MTVGSVTLVEGANATVPPNTSFPVVTSNDGPIPLVGIGYVDGSSEAQPLMDENGVFIQGEATLSGPGISGDTATNSTVADTASSTTIIASNADRTGWCIRNTSSAHLFIAFGGTASATNCVAELEQYDFIRDAGLGVYTGAITGIWASDPGDGAAVWTEW